MKKIKTITIFLLALLGFNLVFSLNKYTYVNQVTNETENAKLSNGNIIIQTPENKTYPSPMRGYYPATYGFESDETGKNPSNWQIDDNGGSATIIDSFNGHEKVFHLEDNSTGGNVRVEQAFGESQSFGTIEFWIADSNATNSLVTVWIELLDSKNDIKIRLVIDDNQLRYANGTEQHVVINNFENNVWHQVGIDFNAGMDRCDIWADGIKVLPYENWFNPGDNITEINFNTRTNRAYNIYIDALGYSWDPYYNEGDNLYEGLLLSYNIIFPPDWMGYSLDSQSNKTIFGNSTIHLHYFGTHTIQVFANDSIGTMYSSDIRYFQYGIYGPFNLNYKWNRTWGGIDDDQAFDIAIDSVDNVYIAGQTDASNDMAIVKYSSSGVKQWHQTYSNSESAQDIVMDSSDNIYIAGFKLTNWVDIFIAKYNEDGVEQWSQTWGGIDQDYGFGITLDSLENVYVAGTTKSYGAENYDIVLVKYNNDGIKQWNRTWGGWSIDQGFGVAVDSYDNVYVAGNTYSFGSGNYDMVLIKYNSSGAQLWNCTWGGASNDDARAIIIDSYDIIYLIGYTVNSESLSDMALVAYNSSGVKQWNRIWGGEDEDYGYDIILDSSENIYAVGSTNSYGRGNEDICIIKFNNSGMLQWHTWGENGDDFGFGIAVDSLDNIYFTGKTNSFGSGGDDIVLVKYGLDTENPEIIINNPSQDELFGDIAPNYDISIIESNLESIWYTFNDGVTNITISEFTGTIDQIEWEKKETGMLTIKFYANDTMGNEGYAEVSVFKDIDNPDININNPSQDERFGVIAPEYDISIVEPNLESFWYTIDGAITNYTITQFSGTINQEAWDAAPYNNITIRFYANDLLGNIGYNEVFVEKVEEVSNGEPAIFGYNVLLIISLIGLITAIILKRKFN